MYFVSDIAAINSFIISFYNYFNSYHSFIFSFYNSFINKNFSSQKFLI